MRLRSGRHLVSPPPVAQGGNQRLRSLDDRINSLPKDLLLKVLVRLGFAQRAVCVGAVCRRWHGLWTLLPELTFGGVEPCMLEAVLAKVTRPRLDLLNIIAATRLVPEKLIFCVWDRLTLEDDPIEVPCFDRTSSLSHKVMFFHLVPPPSGEFTVLRSLSLVYCRGIDIRGLLPLCPSLRVLNMYKCVEVDTMIVHSSSLEELNLKSNDDLRLIDIAAPVLKELSLKVWLDKDFSLSFSAPMVMMLKWKCVCDTLYVGLNGLWKLYKIRERKQHDFQVVSLDIHFLDEPAILEEAWSFAQMIAQLPVPVFSVMELNLKTRGHAFGPLVLHVLRIRPAIQSVKLLIARGEGGAPCPVNCPCEQYSNWRTENISLPSLEVVEIHGLQGEDDEVDFLKLILRSAPVLMRLTTSVSDDGSPSDNGQQKMCGIMKEYPDVEYDVPSS